MQALALGRQLIRGPRGVRLRRLSYPKVPLSEALPQFTGDTSRSGPIVAPERREPAVISQLQNGLRVASESAFGQFCAVGVIVKAGSRCELNYPSGVTHILSRMAGNSTEHFKDRDHILNAMNAYGGTVDCQMFRDVIIYLASAYTHCLPEVMKVLSEMIWRPRFTEEELEQEKMAVAFELEDMLMRPDPQPLLEELIYHAAFRDNTLGLPMICPKENLPLITTSHLKQYVTSHFTPQHMAIAGCGVSHSQLVELAQEYFVEPRRSWEVEPLPVDESLAQYTGGEKTMHRSAPPVVGPNPLPDLNHVVLAMEGVDYFHPDLYTFAVMNSLMGGGGSFSAGGPGKGMYSQLYLNVLNQHHSVYSALAQNFSSADAGLFCLFGSAAPTDTRQLTEILCKQFFSMAREPNKGDVARAKKQLQSNLMMNLESRLIQFENVARQVLEYNKVISTEELCAKIEEVTAADLARVGEKMLHSRPSLAVLGNLQHAPPLEEVERAMANGGTLPKKNRLFSFS